MPSTIGELEAMSWNDMKLVFALTYAQAIRAVIDQGEAALRTEVERWEPEAPEGVVNALAEAAGPIVEATGSGRSRTLPAE